MKALVRSVSSSFAQAITMQPQAGATPCFEAAVTQHSVYVQLLKSLLGPDNVTQLPADDKHPDCCFVEDTAVVVGHTAIIARIGAQPRQGEEAAVATVLDQLGYKLQHIQPPGLLDGGDVLQLPGSRVVVVGLSRRTNAAALQQMQSMLPQHTLHAVSVAHGLHLKSACTALDSSTLLYADNQAGLGLKQILQDHPALSTAGAGQPWQHVVVQPECANVLLLAGPGGQHVVMCGGFPESERIIGQLAAAKGLQLHELEFGEFAKADGSLTCCSILLPEGH